jgi:uncharacterized repeat protein (TIGR03803 family)
MLKRFLLFTLAAVLGSSHAAAQIFSPLHAFDGFDGSDGGFPLAGLVISGNTLYGTTAAGGNYEWGAIFKINTDGTGLTNLYSFSLASKNSSGSYTNSDGFENDVIPHNGLILSNNALYGTKERGGIYGNGTIFRINTDGTDFTNMHNFSAGSTNSLGIYTNSDGANPIAGLVLSGNMLYGTADGGGTNGNGIVFAINTDGSGFTNLYNFTALNSGTNSDGANPYAGLILSGNSLYGTAQSGGTNGTGTVFAINTDGTGFNTLYAFSQVHNRDDYEYTNSDGADPRGNLILCSNTLYGTAYAGGYYGAGTVFALHTDGTCFTNLYEFDGYGGANPQDGFILSGNKLYGTTETYGAGYNGTVFAINTDGTDFAVLCDFVGDGIDGSGPNPLILSGNTFYGTTQGAGNYGSGTVFALSLGSIPLNIQAGGQNQILTWGNPAFSLQTAPVLTGQWTTVFNAASPYTVSATNAQSFFRLAYPNTP